MIYLNQFSGAFTFKNNILVDTVGSGYICPYGNTPSPIYSSNNLWWSTGSDESSLVPSWDTAWAHQYANPLFTNAGANNFTLQSGSPAIDNGYNASAVLTRDILDISRPQGSAFDIGAYEYSSGASNTTPPASPAGLTVY